MSTLISLPVLALVLITQMVVFSRLPLLGGTADILLLTVIAWAFNEKTNNSWIIGLFAALMFGFVSAIPFYVPVVSYLIAVGIVRVLLQRVWQMPILAMVLASFLATFTFHVLSIIVLKISGSPISIGESFQFVTLPSVLLNLLLALPVYAIVTDIASWVYPDEEFA